MSGFTILDLSNELIHGVFSNVDALDLASLAKTCRRFSDVLRGDELVWKTVYLSDHDAPAHTPKSWALAVQNLIRAKKILQSRDFELKKDNTGFIGAQILPMLLATTTSYPTSNIEFLQPHFHYDHQRTTASTLLRQSSLFRRCGGPFDQPADSVFLRQLSARLHVYSGLPLEVRESEIIASEGAQYIHPYARSRVYDLRRYKSSNFWGPFMNDGSGRIDWERVQSIWLVLGYGLRMISERTNGGLSSSIGWGMGMGVHGDRGMWEGLAANSYKPYDLMDRSSENDEVGSNAATAGSQYADDLEFGDYQSEDGVPPIEWFEKKWPKHPLEAEFQRQQALFAKQDPYGVTGTWMRVVNFLDFNDLYAFNFGTSPRLPEHIEREPVVTAEAFRLILLTLWITKIEWPDEDDVLPEDWETVDETSSAEGTRCSTPLPGSEERTTNATRESSTPNSLNSHSERVGSTSSDGLYHKPAFATGKSAEIQAEASTSSQPTKRKAKYPIVHFEGRSQSLHIRWDPNANSQIRGQVRAYPSPPPPQSELQTDPGNDLSHIYPATSKHATRPTTPPLTTPNASPNGLLPDDDLVIRWTTFSIFHGEPRWRSEGVQIGGLKSARGILGNWFDKDFDIHGPAGPTGFWKISDRAERYPKARRGVFDAGDDGPFWDVDDSD